MRGGVSGFELGKMLWVLERVRCAKDQHELGS
jgi:hypothetical protein